MDITERLRKWTFAVDAQPASDLMDEAANEIDRLRSGAVESRGMVRQKSDCQLLVEYIDSSQRTLAFEQEAEIARLRLTDAEREAVDRARRAFRDMDHNDMTMQQLEDYEALCGLLERLK